MNRRKLMLIFICLIFGIFVSYSQSSEIYFYRFNSLLQSELPVYLMSDGKQLAVVQPGGRYKIVINSSGSYSFQAKMNPSNPTLSNVTIKVEAGQDYYVKTGAALGLDLATITNVAVAKGQKDIAKGRKFVGDIHIINTRLDSEVTIGETSRQPKNTRPSRVFQPIQIVDNFKFEIVDMVKAGDRLELRYLITNMASDDRILRMHGSDVFFYDNMGNLISANEICIGGNCRDWRTIKSLTYHTKNGETYASQYGGAEMVIPFEIPIKSRIVFHGLKNAADRFVRGQMMFHTSSKDGRNKKNIKLAYYNLMYPTAVDPNNPNRRNVGDLSIEYLDVSQEGGHTILHYKLYNNSREQYELNLTRNSVFYDDQGNSYSADRISFVTKSQNSSYNNPWEKQVLSGHEMSFFVYLKDVSSSASQISRATLDFNDFNLSWNNIPLKKNRFTPEGVKTATSVNPATKDYLTYVDFEEKVKKHESVTGKRIVLENIYFTSGSDNILPSSNSQLNKLTNLLKNSAYLKVEVSGHTDNIGDDMSNMLLSQKRADAIKYYLIEKSISPSRIASIGKGKDEPIRENETVAGRKENRRVEILVVE